MDLRQLRQLVAVAEELHFGRAAARLNMSQPPLSFGIRQLEEQLGVMLFYRTKRRVEVTPAGRVLVDEAKAILSMADYARDLVKRVGCEAQGSLRIGYTDEFELSPLAKIVVEFKRTHPNVYIDVVHFFSDTLERKVRNNELDLAFLNLPLVGADPIGLMKLKRIRLMAILPLNHRLAQRPHVKLTDITKQQVLCVQPLSRLPFEQRVAQLVDSAMAVPIVEYGDCTLNMLISMVREGMGILITAEGSGALMRSDVVQLPILHDDAWLEQAVIFRTEDASPALAEFLNATQAAFA